MPDMMDEGKRLLEEEPSPAAQMPNWVDPVHEHEIVARRRQIHAIPEAGWTEFIATARAAEYFEALGFKVRIGREVIDPVFIRGRNAEEVELSEEKARAAGVSETLLARMSGITGMVATFDTGRPGRTIAIRVELDALYMDEPEDSAHIPYREGFTSMRRGVMHACGHDGHQAVAYALADFVIANKERLNGSIKFIFQPGEEGSRGAYPMVKSGALDDVDLLLCSHIALDLPAGTVVSAAGKFLCTTKIDFIFEGAASHAGMTRVNVGTLHAGEGRNIVASHAKIEVEVRGESEAINHQLTSIAIQRAEGCAMAFGVGCRHLIMGEAVDFVPDDAVTQMIAVCARRARRCKDVLPTAPLNSSDDATLMIRRVQSMGGKAGYFLVGAALPGENEHANVDFAEESLLTLYDMYTNLLIGFSGGW